MAAKPVEEVLRIEDLAVSHNDSDDPVKQDALTQELQGVRNLNEVMENVITAMTKAKDNMDVPTFPLLPNFLRQSVQPSKTQIDY
jgi:hypothetical protein